MITNNTKLKELPENIKFASYNSNNEDVILGEYLIALLIFNGESLNKILKSADEIEDKKEREEVKKIMYNIILDFIELNPEFDKILKTNNDNFYKY